MINLTFSEAYTLSFIDIPRKNIKTSSLSHILLGLYVCDFLDFLETRAGLSSKKKKGNLQDWINEYFLNPRNIWDRENILISILERLNQLKLLKIKKEKIFNHFSLIHCIYAFNFKNWIATPPTEARNDISGSSLRESAASEAIQLSLMKSIIKKKSRSNLFPLDNFNEFILHSIESYKAVDENGELREIIELFNKKLFSLFKEYKKSKYELRFFWPNSIIPEVYKCFEDLFNVKNYSKEYNKDKYILKNNKLILKFRNHKFSFKKKLNSLFNITQFTKKIKIPFKKTLFESIFEKTIVNVIKERYINKIAPHSKIEFSIIKIKKNEWKTICIESNKIETVLALSFLVNQEHAEKLTYSEFLNEHSKVRL